MQFSKLSNIKSNTYYKAVKTIIETQFSWQVKIAAISEK